MEERTHLYHCTNSEALLKIIKYGQFHPSFCLETLSVLPQKMKMAYAVVCFADLMRSELNDHMSRFKADSYIRMKKDWALKNDVSPVIYYKENSLMSALLKNVILHATKDEVKQNPKYELFNKSVWVLMAFLKEYDGKYYNKIKNEYSDVTQFYTEREWRYVPKPRDYEAYYITEKEFLNASFREEKKKELVDHGYALKFNWQDVEEIGIPKDYKHLLNNIITNNDCQKGKVQLL